MRLEVSNREGQNNYDGISVTLARTFSELAKHRGVRERERRKTSGGAGRTDAAAVGILCPAPARSALCALQLDCFTDRSKRDKNCTVSLLARDSNEKEAEVDDEKVIAI